MVLSVLWLVVGACDLARWFGFGPVGLCLLIGSSLPEVCVAGAVVWPGGRLESQWLVPWPFGGPGLVRAGVDCCLCCGLSGGSGWGFGWFL